MLERSRTNRTRGDRSIAFTLVEVLIVVVMMSILAGVVTSSFSNAIEEAKYEAMRADELMLRSAIVRYRADHRGATPALRNNSLPQLTTATNVAGMIGVGADYPYGPYVDQIPANPLNESGMCWPTTEATLPDLEGRTGWWYDAVAGKIWAGRRRIRPGSGPPICP